ncbi:hypothetical protein NQ318_010808 [Aromia moschata]|uniref:Small ribosomal subunit protein eS21 n=1 Tax=Aromia moschata TaxID=1265417 RepID=A0AAV8XQ39_9CUCU|nr:hypothetical protein NQ318_010808 [Aromia moschata]
MACLSCYHRFYISVVATGTAPGHSADDNASASEFSASNRIIHAKDHASIQLSIAEVDPQTGRMTENSKSYALCGAIRRMGESDDCIVRLTKKDGILAKYNEEPRSLSNLLEFFEKSNLPANKTDLLVGLVYILMLESGFVPIEQRYSCEECSFNYQRLLMFSRQLPKNWKRDSLYTFSFVLPPFQVYECSLAFVLAADDLLVNCVVKGVESGHFNTILDPLFYFTSSTTQVSTHKLQNLNQLSRAVKNSVCYPAKQILGLPPSLYIRFARTIECQLCTVGETGVNYKVEDMVVLPSQYLPLVPFNGTKHIVTNAGPVRPCLPRYQPTASSDRRMWKRLDRSRRLAKSNCPEASRYLRKEI